jgi:hypothetical protein
VLSGIIKTMPIKYTYSVSGDVLHVKTMGTDKDLDEVQKYGAELIGICKEHHITKVLADERDLEYTIGVIDTLQLAQYYSRKLPILARVAVVANSKYWDDAQFWETASKNRGLNVRVFTSYKEAKQWIEE